MLTEVAKRPDRVSLRNTPLLGTIFEAASIHRPEAEKRPPHVTLRFDDGLKVEGPLLLHPNGQPSPLVADQTDGTISLPSGVRNIWMSVDEREYLINDSTTSPDTGEGVRGVIISHGGVLAHETRYTSYGRDGSEKGNKQEVYSMPAGKHEYFREGEEKNLAGLSIAYNSDVHRM